LDLQIHSPERFAKLKTEAEERFTEAERGQAWHNIRVNTAIRWLITERFIEKKTLQKTKAE
jgi:hypothetical protein